jgi:putative hydrolase of the HAD superfamily
MIRDIKAVLFDFGGVIAEEGFYEGLRAIGKQNRLDPQKFFSIAEALIHETGYVVGAVDEAQYWRAVRDRTGISGDNGALRQEILKRFAIRPGMVAHADRFRARGKIVAMLSDQTNWLDEINAQTGLFSHFDRVFNSFAQHKSKRDASVFVDACSTLGVVPEETLFIDDNPGHVQRARGQGLQTILFVSQEDFERRLLDYR